ncbi:MAG: hypothetical protein KatS3mg006_2209 [Pyrinomonadaceae bacterium]|jgi:O-antigen ligase|nr:MAG: hypothetical protein KatS3mg006_2209 [Pyrinomonadaceae bacterium]
MIKTLASKIVALIDRCIHSETDHPKLERAIFVFLFLMVLFLPHSIAASQTAWILGMLFLSFRLFLKPKIQKTPLDKPLWAFALWSLVTCFFSYTPLISLDKMRSVAVFLIFYFVVNIVRSNFTATVLAFTLILSCMINVFYVPIERIIGRGVEIHGLRPDSPLSKALLMDGDTLLKANDKKIQSPEDLIEEIQKNEKTAIFFYRPDFYYTVEVNRSDLLRGESALEKLGIESWSKSHNWRSTGFYGHWTTYADVLQLIASLTFGILVTLASNLKIFSTRENHRLTKRTNSEENTENYSNSPSADLENTSYVVSKKSLFQHLLFPINYRIGFLIIAFFFAMMVFALVLSGTRAPLAGLLISTFVIVLLNKNRKIIYFSVAAGLSVILLVSIYLQQSRHTGFIDKNDDSTKYRQTVYKEAIDLWIQKPRHLLFGVGMDSIRVYATEWKLFDSGRLPIGHFHSTPIQLLVERGLPALLIWIWIIFGYSKMLLSSISNSSEMLEKGILLGIFGGMIGFLISGIFHYNLGDQEVAMIFFFLMGIGFVIKNSHPSTSKN